MSIYSGVWQAFQEPLLVLGTVMGSEPPPWSRCAPAFWAHRPPERCTAMTRGALCRGATRKGPLLQTGGGMGSRA